MTDLITRLQSASEGEQRALLQEAFDFLFPEPDWDNGRSQAWLAWSETHSSFTAKLDAEAYVDAALMLAGDFADEMELTTLYQVARVGLNLNHGPDAGPYYGENVCNVKSLAIAAASLKAMEG